VVRHYDLVYEELGEDIGHEDFVQDMILAFNGNGWCQRDYFKLRADQALSFSWERFAEVVKHESRYLFLEHRDDDAYGEQHEVEPADMLVACLDALGP
jgi:HEPN/RES N-terminal domain 1